MWKFLCVIGLAFTFMPLAQAQGERRCCHVVEGVWLDGTYTPADCRAQGEDFAPQGDGRAAMCTHGETTEIPPSPPGAPGSPGGGPGDGPGGNGGGGGGDGAGGGGAGVQMPEETSLADERFGYEEVGRATLGELEQFLERAMMQRDFCDTQIHGTDAEDRAAPSSPTECYGNLRSNAHLITQNAGRMRNDREISEEERHEVAHIRQTASDLRSYADDQLESRSAD